VIAIVIHWERAAWAYKSKEALHKIQKWHTFGMKAYGVNKLLIVDVDKSNPNWSDAEMKVDNYATLERALEEIPEYEFVYVEYGVPGSIPLSEYKHPKNSAYIFGSDYGATLEPKKKDCVLIEQSGEYPYLWAAQCIPIVLHDRYVKENM